MSEKNKIKIGITHGDYNGVGYDVIIKALADERITELFTPVIFGSSDLAARAVRRLKIEDFHFTPVKRASEALEGHINVVDVCTGELQPTPGIPSAAAGKAAVEALEAAAEALDNHEIDLLVTAPIDKRSAQSETFSFPGHTEFLESRFGKEGARSLMILFDDHIRVALLTTHVPVSKIAEHVKKEAIVDTLRRFNDSLKRDFGFERPRIAVLGLNPHCGDAGTIGSEDQEEIIPAIEECQSEGMLVFGPMAADGFFGSGGYNAVDGVLAMYHDQGLAPFKALSRENGVNFTAGLSVVRTSPAHGTAYDKAGRGIADETSMRQALYKAIDIARTRRRYREASANPLVIVEHKSKSKSKDKDKE